MPVKGAQETSTLRDRHYNLTCTSTRPKRKLEKEYFQQQCKSFSGNSKKDYTQGHPKMKVGSASQVRLSTVAETFASVVTDMARPESLQTPPPHFDDEPFPAIEYATCVFTRSETVFLIPLPGY